MAKSRDFTIEEHGKTINLRVNSITPEVRNESQKYYSAGLNNAIMSNMPLRIEVEQMLESKGLMDTKHDEELITGYNKQLRELEVKLRGAKNEDGSKMTRQQGREIALEMQDIRFKLREVGSTLSDYFNNTADNFATNEQMQYFIFASTIDRDKGGLFWPTFEDFKTDTESAAFSEATQEFLTMISGYDKDHDKKLYENSWLIRMGFMDDKLRLINEDGKLIDEDGRLIDEEGNYIDAEGNFVDKYGNPIDEDGNLLVTEEWDFPEKESPQEEAASPPKEDELPVEPPIE